MYSTLHPRLIRAICDYMPDEFNVVVEQYYVKKSGQLIRFAPVYDEFYGDTYRLRVIKFNTRPIKYIAMPIHDDDRYQCDSSLIEEIKLCSPSRDFSTEMIADLIMRHKNVKFTIDTENISWLYSVVPVGRKVYVTGPVWEGYFSHNRRPHMKRMHIINSDSLEFVRVEDTEFLKELVTNEPITYDFLYERLRRGYKPLKALIVHDEIIEDLPTLQIAKVIQTPSDWYAWCVCSYVKRDVSALKQAFENLSGAVARAQSSWEQALL